MKPIIIHEPVKNAKRIKIFIPYDLFKERACIKKMNSSFWHPNQQLWSVVNTRENFTLLKEMFHNNFILKKDVIYQPIPTSNLSEKALSALFKLEKALVLKQYGISTIRVYKKMFSVFLAKFGNRNLSEVTKEEIEGFVYELIKKSKISESYQNQLINAIKAYYEHALKLPKEYYEDQNV